MPAKKKSPRRPIRSADVPVTARMLSESEDRLIHRMDAGFERVREEISGLRSEMHGMKSDIHGIKSEMHGMKSDIHGIKSEMHGTKADIHSIKSELHRVALLVEEQNARNKYVLDGYAQIFELLTAKI